MAKVKQKYRFAVIAVDVAIFVVEREELKVLLIKMKRHPYEDAWALPGGLVKPVQSVDDAARRQLEEKTGVSHLYLEQLYTFGRVDRDPFGRVVSVAYMALLPDPATELKTTAEYGGVRWFPVRRLPKLAYDHAEIVRVARARLEAKLGYTNIAYSLLSPEFTLSELQQVYETILGRELDKRNFRKKILALGLVVKTGRKREGHASRPAMLYRFKTSHPQIVEIL